MTATLAVLYLPLFGKLGLALARQKREDEQLDTRVDREEGTCGKNNNTTPANSLCGS